MRRTVYFITHPNVVISPEVPVPQWPLSERGRERMRQALALPWMRGLGALFCSTEQKAIDGAEILARALSLPCTRLEALGENDRSSMGFLPPPEFEAMADRFFAEPERSVCGWERAIDAQSRIVGAVERLIASAPGDRPIGIVSHGAVGTLLFCALTQRPIDRRWDQPANGGGNCFSFTTSPTEVHSGWLPIDDLAASAGTGT